MTPLILTPEAGGERLDAFLARSVEGLTRSAAQRLLEEGAVTSGGRPLKKSEKTAPGQVIQVVLPEPEPVDVLPQNIPLDVVYEDSDVIVVNKPVGMVVHPAPGHPDGTLVNALLYHCGNTLSGINGELRPGIVHRIDRDTSGLIIAAKNDKAHLALAEQLQDHSLARVYEAVAVGNFREDSGTVDAPIGRHPVDRKKMAIEPRNGRPAVTHWRVLARYPGHTHVELGLHPCGVPPGDRPHPPDPGPPGLYRPPPPGGHGVRQQKALPRPGRPVFTRPKTDFPASEDRGAGGAGVPPARLVPGGAGQAGADVSINTLDRHNSGAELVVPRRCFVYFGFLRRAAFSRAMARARAALEL